MSKRLQTQDLFHLGEVLESPGCRLSTLDLSGNCKALTKGLAVLLFALRQNKHLTNLIANDTVLTSDGVFQPLRFLIRKGESNLREISLLNSHLRGGYD